MNVFIPREIYPSEQRVATTPEVVSRLLQLGFSVNVESQAGVAASFNDSDYEKSGAKIVNSTDEHWHNADIILKVRAPLVGDSDDVDEITKLKNGQILVCFIWPAQNPQLLERLSAQQVTTMAMDMVPRISRAQKLDALSSMANIAGYRALIEAGQHFGRFFTGQITAAGKVPPAKVLVIGAGVAGLSAIGTANSLGAIVRAFDTRLAAKEQVESMNADFLELSFSEDGDGDGGYAKTMSKEFIDAEMKLFHEQAKEVDIIVTTALIPGKPAPVLITKEMVKSMKPGSVVVDLAAEQGGNCELTQPGKVVIEEGVSIIGYTDLPSRMAAQSSQLYGTNLYHLLTEITPEKNGTSTIDMSDEVVRSTTVTHQGDVTWPPPAVQLSAAPAPTKSERPAAPEVTEEELIKQKKKRGVITMAGMAISIALILGVGSVAPDSFMKHFMVFILSCFIGWQVIWNVTPALHTPLMSVTNAISGIIIIGAVLQVGSPSNLGAVLAVFAALIATINIAGGFLVTRRMLNMFQK